MPPTGERARVDDELRRAYDGDCWHGPPLLEVLQGITAQTAAVQHPQLAHSIWALVNHLAAWIEVAARRITEWRAITEPDAGNFPPVTDTSGAAWAATLNDLDRRHQTLLSVVANLAPEKLDAVVPGKTYAVAVMLHGTSQHYAYHAGQIALLKKLVGA
ncbi:DinB superfamily protein [Gemmata sp. SH-PL17]|uniref:DinB family protein n=1 Tax=Gemmata sp. SH-PL17 TaxID=1630693 RepID=UPI0004AD9D75|nr:DinB family protein [Gemmata sp. SH-PL17]AMV23717.1 DinB superfamily protein [Gemmata sp. SH-PL17]